MRIADLMSGALVQAELDATDREGALREVVDHLVANAPVRIDGSLAFSRLVERERLASTAVGHGIAIPHAKLPRLDRAVACLSRSSSGVAFGSRDGEPTRIFLTIVAPEDNAGLHLKALARASRLLMNDAFREEMVSSADAEAIWRALLRHDEELPS